MPNGKLLIAGGFSGSSTFTSAEIYDPGSGIWMATGSLATERARHTATLLPSGKVIMTGGAQSSRSNSSLASAELFDPATGASFATGNLGVARRDHTGTLLGNGKVLVAGGIDGSGGPSASAELFDPVTGTWATTGALGGARSFHTATLLANGKVLVAGGRGSMTLASAELYDPGTGTWSAAGSLAAARTQHSATLLSDGMVLIAGGFNESGVLAKAEVYDPATGTWTSKGNLATARRLHTATLLPNGEVLVAGGYNDGTFSTLASAELYGASGTWSATGSLTSGRFFHTATLLPNDKVLVAGGFNGVAVASADLYDSASGTWTGTSSLASPRTSHRATLLPNGQVLITGGGGSGGNLANVELYDPAHETWTVNATLGAARSFHAATLLLDGRVLIAAGEKTAGNQLPNAELYDVGLQFNLLWQPNITSAPTTLVSGSRLQLGGKRFQGVSQASGGNVQDSSTNYPVVQLRSIDSGRSEFLLSDAATSWSDSAFTSVPVGGLPSGPAMVTVFTNGIPSVSKYLVVAPLPDGVLKILSITHPAVHTIQLDCLGVPNAMNRIEASLDLSPDSFATLASIAVDASGVLNYTDTSAGERKFYRLAFP